MIARKPKRKRRVDPAAVAVAGVVSIEFPRRSDADAAFDAFESMLRSMLPKCARNDALRVGQRGNVVAFGASAAVLKTLGFAAVTHACRKGGRDG